MAESAGDIFAEQFGRPDPEVPPGLFFPDDADQLIWDTMCAKTGAGWFRNRFLYLFGEGLEELRPCLEAWSFLLPDHVRNPMIVGRNAYGAIALIEDAANGFSRLGVLDPLTVTYVTDGDALRLGSFIGRYLPEKLIPRFLDQGVYDAFVAEGWLYLDRELCLAIEKPLSLDGEMVLGNFAVEGIVDYYRSTGPIYARAMNKTPRPLWTPDVDLRPSDEEAAPVTDLRSGLGKEVRDALRGVGALGGGLPSDCSPLDAVDRAYGELGAPVSRAVAACLTDGDPSIRALAALFFERHSDAPGAEALVRVWSTRPELFVGVENPWMMGYPLAWQLLHAIGTRVLLRDPRATEVAKREALVAGRAQPLIAALTRVQPRWVAAHAAEIVGKSPEAAAPLLIHMSYVDVGALGERIAPLAMRDPELRSHLERFMEEGPAKRRILAAIR